MLCLPSTPFAFKLLEACAERGMPTRAVGHPALAAQWWPGAAKYMVTPLALWRTVRESGAMPAVTVVFQDQLVAVDDSYIQIRVLDQSYHVSPIECMLIARFRPLVYIGRINGEEVDELPGPILTRYRPALPKTMTNGDLEQIMTAILEPLVAIEQAAPQDWFASCVFALKRGNNFNAMLSQQVQEMEALWRLYRWQHGVSPDETSLGRVFRDARTKINGTAH